jgi:hypothetical protein
MASGSTSGKGKSKKAGSKRTKAKSRDPRRRLLAQVTGRTADVPF